MTWRQNRSNILGYFCPLLSHNIFLERPGKPNYHFVKTAGKSTATKVQGMDYVVNYFAENKPYFNLIPFVLRQDTSIHQIRLRHDQHLAHISQVKSDLVVLFPGEQ